MTDQQDPRSEQYDQARRAFEDLRIEDRALFLIQEAFSTVIYGAEAVSRAIVRELDELFREAEEAAAREEARDEPVAPAEPVIKTPKKRATGKKSGPRSTSRKKPTGETPPPSDDES